MRDDPKILLLRRRGLGDLLVSLDLLRALRAKWPASTIEVLVDRPLASVLEACPGIDAARVYDAAAMRRMSWLPRVQAGLKWMQELRAQKYDVVLDLMGTPQTALWTRRTGAARRVGIERAWRSWAYTLLLPSDAGEKRFAGERSLDFARALGIDPGAWRPTELVAPELGEPLGTLLKQRLRPLVGLNPSATWEAKAWPAEHWAALARLLSARLAARPLMLWGPGDEGRRDAIQRLSGAAVETLPATSLRESTGVLAGLDLLITTDSGPKHLAVAVGTPTLTLFGSTDPRGWQPALARHEALHDTALPCRPCDLLECPLDGHPCMEGLLPDVVGERALEILGRAGKLSGDAHG
jgi:ADP-heptose:LPS heptosyltransferase